MATPYAPSNLSLANFDATQAATATWTFSSSDTTVTQQSFQLQIYNNSTGSVVLDTGVVNNTLSQYTIPASTLVNRTVYKFRVQYTDSSNNVSPWSQYVVFTCSSLPTTSITSPTASQTITGNTVTVSCNYSQAQLVTQQSFRLVVYASDQTTVVQDTTTTLGSTNQYTFNGLTSGTYYVQSTVVSSDGLNATSGKIQFILSYTGGVGTPNISITPLSSSASIRIDWQNEQQLLGTYVGSGAIYQTGKFNQAIKIAAVGEKVYWNFAGINQFTYTNWWIPNVASSAMKNNQVIARLQADSNNYIQMRYDPFDSTFFLEKSVNGKVMTTKSQTGLTFAANAQLFIAIQQTATSVIGYVGINNNLYSFQFQPYQTYATSDMLMGDGGMLSPSPTPVSTYGAGYYGTAQYSIDDPGVISNITYAYIGCSPIDGNEANALFDQTHLTTNLLTQSTIQSLYQNATLQTFTLQTVFLANFDGNLVGGTGNTTTIASWNVYRTVNGIRKKIGNVAYNANSGTVTYTDYTPLSNITYSYDVVTVDPNGNEGTPQSISGSVVFDGWWLTDTSTNTSFQILANIGEVPLKTNYKRGQYETFGTYPIVVYAPTKYKSGKLTGWLVSGLNGAASPIIQYQTLQGIIDNHHPLLLRDSTGWGIMADCYDPTDTIQDGLGNQYCKVELTWTEVAAVS